MQDIHRFIPASQLTDLPSLDGHPSTRTIVTSPDDGSSQPLWCAQMLRLDTSGLVAGQEGMDCIGVLTSGGPLLLTRTASGNETTVAPGGRLYFAGETLFQAASPDGPTEWFQLMLARKQAHGCVDVRRGDQALPLRPGETLLHCVQGQFRAELPAHLGGHQTLAAGDTVHLTLDYVPFFRLNLLALTPDARLVDARVNQYPTA
ncbi:MAG: HutD family protein [Castellaniella sp.]